MNWTEAFKSKVIEPSDLKKKSEAIKAAKKTIVTLNGSFDLLHAGHLHIIYEASKLADVLIIALNSDASIKRYKSEHRPLISLNERMQMIAALECVDYVTYFEETDPCKILEIICPNVHANGAEYGEHCIEAKTVKENGGRIHIISLLPGLSTSSLIKKIHQLPT